MIIDFDNIEYLRTGNEKQRRAYVTLTKSNLFTILQAFDPILVGTIPINIDIENSDLDIICYCKHQNEFSKIIREHFGNADQFRLVDPGHNDFDAVIASFVMDDFEIEIFGQNIPTKQQNAYRHMVIENRLLIERGDSFRKKIIELKQKGHKTEPAFAIALGLKGDPYTELLSYETWIQGA